MITVEFKTHTELLNYIAEKIKAKSYLEIGVFNPEHNYNKINVEKKYSVDPDPNAKADVKLTSDDFFEAIKVLKKPKTFDLIFIDGLHHLEQVRKDLVNAWQCLNKNGVIVMHDTNPPTEQTTCVPRGSQREWCGDVYRVACEIDKKFTVDFDYGCTVIRKTEQPIMIEKNKIKTWQYFDKNRKGLLNLVTIEEALKIIDSW